MAEKDLSETPQRWTAKRRSTLVLSIRIRPRNPIPLLTAVWGEVWGMRRGRGRA